MENFITQHRKLTIFIAVLVVIGLVAFAISTSLKPATTSTDQTNAGNDDTEGGKLLLPYQNPIYTIAQNPTSIKGVPDGNNLLISAPVGYRTAAAQSIYDLGFDPTNYKISFDYGSPFAPYE